jgi:hypothetical protein
MRSRYATGVAPFFNAAEEAHGRVRVAVDQAGHDDAAARVDYFRRFVLRFDLGCFSHRCDGIRANHHRAIVDNATLRIHRNNNAVHDYDVGFILRRAWQHSEQHAETVDQQE